MASTDARSPGSDSSARKAAAAGLAFGPSRALLTQLLPVLGEGPSEKTRRTGFFRLQIHTRTSAGVRYLAKIEARGDPGYAATSVMLGESALCLALDRDGLPDRTGVLTPATAMGAALADRLRSAGQPSRCDGSPSNRSTPGTRSRTRGVRSLVRIHADHHCRHQHAPRPRSREAGPRRARLITVLAPVPLPGHPAARPSRLAPRYKARPRPLMRPAGGQGASPPGLTNATANTATLTSVSIKRECARCLPAHRPLSVTTVPHRADATGKHRRAETSTRRGLTRPSASTAPGLRWIVLSPVAAPAASRRLRWSRVPGMAPG
jgi:hypothetical protein